MNPAKRDAGNSVSESDHDAAMARADRELEERAAYARQLLKQKYTEVRLNQVSAGCRNRNIPQSVSIG